VNQDEGRRIVKKIITSSIAKAALMKGSAPDDILNMPFAKVMVENCLKAYEEGGAVAVLAITKRCAEIIAEEIKKTKKND